MLAYRSQFLQALITAKTEDDRFRNFNFATELVSVNNPKANGDWLRMPHLFNSSEYFHCAWFPNTPRVAPLAKGRCQASRISSMPRSFPRQLPAGRRPLGLKHNHERLLPGLGFIHCFSGRQRPLHMRSTMEDMTLGAWSRSRRCTMQDGLACGTMLLARFFSLDSTAEVE